MSVSSVAGSHIRMTKIASYYRDLRRSLGGYAGLSKQDLKAIHADLSKSLKIKDIRNLHDAASSIFHWGVGDYTKDLTAVAESGALTLLDERNFTYDSGFES